MAKDVKAIIDELKTMKIAISTIEKDLCFSNGLLGKAAKGISELSTNKFNSLYDYYLTRANPVGKLLHNNPDLKKASELPPLPKSKETLMDTECQGVREYCKKSGISVTELIDFHKDQSAEKQDKKTKKEEHLKEKIAPKPEGPSGKLSLSDQIELRIKEKSNE